jgi:ATP phosphoribosyltransferase regulatory subunit
MKKRVERLRGMHDVLPEEHRRQEQVIAQLRALLEKAGYAPVDTPILERSDLFLASFGQEAWQNLYAFRLHQRDLCLRPEYTASICRLYLDHYRQAPLPLRFQYVGPVFRYEAPGRGRYRQYTQLGVELFGGRPGYADAEILQLACDILHALQITSYRLELGHIGVASGFMERLHLDKQAAHLLLSLMEQISRSPEGEQAARARLEALYPPPPAAAGQERGNRQETGPSSLDGQGYLIASLLSGISLPFDDEDSRAEIVERLLWKIGRGEQRQQVFYALDFLRALRSLAGPPPAVFGELRTLLARYQLDASPLEELEALVALVEAAGVDSRQITLNLALGRGIRYYTGLVFEIHACDEDGSDLQLCGGGRYDQLIRSVGGSRDIHACGFAFGLERLISLIPQNAFPIVESSHIMVIPVSAGDLAYASALARLLREEGITAEVDVSGHGVSGGLKLAARRGIALVLIVGEDERRAGTVTMHHLLSGDERALKREQLVIALREEEPL